MTEPGAPEPGRTPEYGPQHPEAGYPPPPAGYRPGEFSPPPQQPVDDRMARMMAAEGRAAGNRKDITLAFVLWFFLGWLGVHRIYLGKVASGLLMLGLWLFSWLLWLVLLGWTVDALLFVWWVVDAFMISGWVRQHNEDARRRAYGASGA